MDAKKHELTVWLFKKRITKSSLAFAMGKHPSIITKHTQGEHVSTEMLELYEAEGVPKSIINKLKRQGV